MHRNMLEICCLMVIVVWGASTMADDPIAISVTRTGLYGCPLTQSKTIQIRIESFKSSSGSEFHRHTIAPGVLSCLEDYGSSELSATDFKSCADATEAAGMRMFQWANGNCTAYVQGILKRACTSRNEDMVLYSLDDALTGHRHKLASGNCLYIDSDGPSINPSIKLNKDACSEGVNDKMFYEDFDGDFETYLADLQALKVKNIETGKHFLTVNKKSSGEYKWRETMVLENNHTAWDAGQPDAAASVSDCVVLSSDLKMSIASCGPESGLVTTYICHEYFPYRS